MKYVDSYEMKIVVDWQALRVVRLVGIYSLVHGPNNHALSMSSTTFRKSLVLTTVPRCTDHSPDWHEIPAKHHRPSLPCLNNTLKD
jgi:hypothetical protein